MSPEIAGALAAGAGTLTAVLVVFAVGSFICAGALAENSGTIAKARRWAATGAVLLVLVPVTVTAGVYCNAFA